MRIPCFMRDAVLGVLLMSCAGQAAAATLAATTLDIPPRLQWDANYGYCGETSLVSAGLYYGQYLSQFDARSAASSPLAQNREDSQLLPGVNDVRAATRAHLQSQVWVNSTPGPANTAAFLTWVKSRVLLGQPVIIGVYTNEYRFNNDPDPTAGQSEYDHIVTVTGVKSRHPMTLPAVYYADDTLTLEDHGIWTNASGTSQYRFSYAFAGFPATRRQANRQTGPVYSLANDEANYGIAITGVTDPQRLTLPVRVSTNRNDESPAMRDGATTRPAPMPLRLTVSVSGLKPLVSYRLYRYSSLGAVPNSGFNAAAAKATKVWTFSVPRGVTRYVQTVPILSNEVAVFRAVPASAP